MPDLKGVARRGYRIYLQKLKVPEEVSSKAYEKERGQKMILKMTLAKDVSKPKFATKYSLESFRRDLQGLKGPGAI